MIIEKISEIAEKEHFVCSDKLLDKALKILIEKRIRVVSPFDARRIYYHICPVIEDGEKKGFEVTYTPETDDWMCDCQFEVFRADRNHICSHILAALVFREEMIKDGKKEGTDDKKV